ncbi:hypothetical protein I656_02576 [Geobacillus sp. WSUCF1]|nr:hypothetical protein I656_02576 [Geobacillus sp. WSUCF1]
MKIAAIHLAKIPNSPFLFLSFFPIPKWKTAPVQSEGGSFRRTMRIGQPATIAPDGTS